MRGFIYSRRQNFVCNCVYYYLGINFDLLFTLRITVIITECATFFFYTEQNAVLKDAADDVMENKAMWDTVTDKRLLILKDQIDQERANIKYLEKKVNVNPLSISPNLSLALPLSDSPHPPSLPSPLSLCYLAG